MKRGLSFFADDVLNGGFGIKSDVVDAERGSLRAWTSEARATSMIPLDLDRPGEGEVRVALNASRKRAKITNKSGLSGAKMKLLVSIAPLGNDRTHDVYTFTVML